MKLFCVILPLFLFDVSAEKSDATYISTVTITNKYIKLASNYKDDSGQNVLECVIDEIVTFNMYSKDDSILVVTIALPEHAKTDSEKNLIESIGRDKSIQKKIRNKIVNMDEPSDSNENSDGSDILIRLGDARRLLTGIALKNIIVRKLGELLVLDENFPDITESLAMDHVITEMCHYIRLWMSVKTAELITVKIDSRVCILSDEDGSITKYRCIENIFYQVDIIDTEHIVAKLELLL